MSARAAARLFAVLIIGMPVVAASAETCASLVPVKRIQPVYPRTALRNGQDGFVEFLIEIDREGKVIGSTVLSSEPEDVFDGAAQAAIQGWLFSPSGTRCAGRQRIDFKLDTQENWMALPPEASQTMTIQQTPEGARLAPPDAPAAEPAKAPK